MATHAFDMNEFNAQEQAIGCTTKTVQLSDDVLIPYLESGNTTGQPVIYLHGLFGSRYEWCRAAPQLVASGKYRLLMPELRGHGQTKVGPEQCTVSQMAADTVAFMDKLGVQQALVIGFSMGGMVNLYLETFYPERVQGAVVIGSGVCANLNRISQWHTTRDESSPSQSTEPSALGVGDAMYLSASRMPSEKLLDSQDALDVFGLTLDPVNKPAFQPMANALATYPGLPYGPLTAIGIMAGPLTGLPGVTEPFPSLPIILRHPVPAWVIQSFTRDIVSLDLGPHVRQRAKAPTLLIWGEYDMFFTPADRAYTKAALPTAQVKEYAEGSHFAHAEKQHQITVVKDILDFFDTIL